MQSSEVDRPVAGEAEFRRGLGEPPAVAVAGRGVDPERVVFHVQDGVGGKPPTVGGDCVIEDRAQRRAGLVHRGHRSFSP